MQLDSGSLGGREIVPLSPDTIVRLDILFDEPERSEAGRLLVEECGNRLPFCEESDAVSLERIRFAALKLSNGELSALRSAVELAQIDWRDLLVAADFAEDTDAHRSWHPDESSAQEGAP